MVIVAKPQMIPQTVQGRPIEGGAAAPFVAEDVFVSRLRAAREQAGAQPLDLLLDGVLLRVGQGRSPGVDGAPHHKSPVVDATQADRLWRTRQTIPGGVGGTVPTDQGRRRAPR